MTLIRAILLAAAAALLCAILWAATKANLWTSFGSIIADPWGIVTLVDLYSGFLFAAVLIWLTEPRRSLAIGLVALTLVLGNIITLAWLALRGLPRILAKL
jgi:hypothetical protein